jgi:hypothetical protein
VSALSPLDPTPAPEPELFAPEGAGLTRAEAASDRIRARFGKDAIIRGRALR